MRFPKLVKTRLRTKILGNILFLILSLALTGGFSMTHFTGSLQSLESVSRSFETSLMYSTDMRALAQQINYLQKDMINSGKDGQADTLSEIKDRFDEMAGIFAAYAKESDESQKDKVSEIAAALPQWKKMLADLSAAVDGGQDVKPILEEKIIPLSGTTYIYLNSLHQKNLDAFRDIVESAKQRQTKVRLQLLGMCAIVLLIGLWISLFTIRKVMALEKTEGMVGSFREGVAALSAIANVVSDHSSQLSDTGTDQANAAQSTAAAMEQINVTVSRTADNARRLGEIAKENDSLAQRGRNAASKMQEGMTLLMEVNKAIDGHLKTTQLETQQLVAIIMDISTKTNIINDIVFQTRLLSFNASVEAARAGEHGRGFSVVAEEVGNLAKVSGKAANEISVLIEQSTRQANDVLNMTQQRFSVIARDLQMKMDEGKKEADMCLTIIDSMYQKTLEASAMSSQMSSACTEQSAALRDIHVTVIELDKTADQVKKVSDVAKTEAQSLETIAFNLNQLVADLEQTLQDQKTKDSEGADDSERAEEFDLKQAA